MHENNVQAARGRAWESVWERNKVHKEEKTFRSIRVPLVKQTKRI